jgi:hypothetical protein
MRVVVGTSVSLLLGLMLFAAAAQAQTSCAAPTVPSITFVPPSDVAVGQTYSIAWKDVLSSDADGSYIVERSLSSTFAALLDSQQTSSTSASFLPLSESGSDGVFHRVRAVAGCDSSKISGNSDVRNVKIVAAKPNVVITVQPKPVFLNVGDSASASSGTMIVENISSATVSVIPAGQALPPSPAFFTIVDPDALDTSEPIVLSPGVAKSLKVTFFNVPTSAPASYQGFVALVSPGSSLAVTPYAFINLKVGSADAATPQFRFKGLPSEYAFFDSYSASLPASGHPTITVQINNPGSTPMQLGAEVGPETWLIPKSGWNASPIPAGGSISVELSADRTKVDGSSPLPRYTYFTIRTKNGQSARLLVQDNDAPSQSGGRQTLDPGVRSYTIPRVVSLDSALGHTVSRIRLSNVSSASLNAELFYTPTGADGGDTIKHATVVVPPNAAVTLTDPLFEIFNLSPATGQMEVRTATEKITSLTVTAETFAPVGTGGTTGYVMPVVIRGEGARVGKGHTIAGVTASGTLRPMLVLAESTGLGFTSGRVTLYDQAGTTAGESTFSVARNGEAEFTDLLAAVKGPSSLTGGRVDITVTDGGGAVVGVLVLADTRQASASALISQPIGGGVTAGKRALGASVARYVIAGVGSGPSVNAATVMVFSATASADAHFDLLYVDALDSSRFLHAVVDLTRGRTVEIANVMEQIFFIPVGTAAQGSLIIDATNGGTVVARLVSSNGTSANLAGSALPVITTTSEALTSARAGMQRPVYFDGLEQSIDPTRGRKWDVLLSEISNGASTLTVRLYESGNRTSPIAQKTVILLPMQQKRLSTIFSYMDLDTDQRRKDRTNVQVVIAPLSGNGTVLAVALGTDNSTGDSAAFLLTPSGGVPATGVTKPTSQAPVTTGRHRAVGH